MSSMWEKLFLHVLRDKGDDPYIRKLVARTDKHKSKEQIDKDHLQISINYGRTKKFLDNSAGYK